MFCPNVIGAPNSLEYRVYIENAVTEKVVSPFHDIPLFANAESTWWLRFLVAQMPSWKSPKMSL
jgi:inorganic pyrophosphatase